MDDSQQINELILAMEELKDLAKELGDPEKDMYAIMTVMITIILSVKIPNVTILPNKVEIAHA